MSTRDAEGLEIILIRVRAKEREARELKELRKLRDTLRRAVKVKLDARWKVEAETAERAT